MPKGYYTGSNYVGFIDGQRMYFPTESEYYEYLKEIKGE